MLRNKEQADEIMVAMEANMATCDGTGEAMIGQNYGAGFGSNGSGLGNGSYSGSRGQYGQHGGYGMKLQDGTCGF